MLGINRSNMPNDIINSNRIQPRGGNVWSIEVCSGSDVIRVE